MVSGGMTWRPGNVSVTRNPDADDAVRVVTKDAAESTPPVDTSTLLGKIRDSVGGG